MTNVVVNVSEPGLSERLDRLEAALNMLAGLGLQAGKDAEMARKSIETLNAEIVDLRGKIDRYTTEQGQKIKDAVDAAIKARDAADDAEFKRVTEELDAIGNELVEFSPSGN